MKKLLLSLILLLPMLTFAQEKPQYVTTVEGVKEYKLNSNGLKILLIPDATQSNVVVNIIYNVGSRHEGYGEKGMAHLLEHMLFKSTKNLGDIKKMLSDKGGNANGTTWFDRTNYFEIFPAGDENLRWSIEMEADRMVNATILQSDLDKEFSVVRNEFEIGENNPGSVLNERVLSTAYIWHNYGNSPIGSKEDIERVTAARLKPFYQKYYQPDNATLVIGGKFDEEKALGYISQYFGVIPRPERVLDNTYTVEPAQDGERFVELRRAGDEQLVDVLYHTVAMADPDNAALDALMEILTANPSGYLYKALVDTHKASSIYGYNLSLRDPGYASIGIDIPLDKSLDDAKTTLLAELDKVPAIDYTDEDLARAKAKLLKSIENIKNNTIRFSINLSNIISAGDYRLFFIYRDEIEKLTLDDIKRVAQKYFRENNRTYGVFIPSKDEIRVMPKEYLDQDIAKLTEGYKGKEQEDEDLSFEATIPNIKTHLTQGKLDNGMKYAFLKKPVKGKKVSATFRFPVANLEALTNKSTIMRAMVTQLKSGTSTMTKEQIQDKLDQTKTSLTFGFGGQDIFVYVNTYQEYLESTFNLIHHLITESVFPENELKKRINKQKSNIESSRNDPESIVSKQIALKTDHYPKGHPFATTTFDEDLAAWDKVTRQDVVDMFNAVMGGENGVGTIIGDIDAAQVQKLLASAFGNWKSKTPYKKIEVPFFSNKASTEIIQTPDKENAAAAGVVTFKMDQKNADYPALIMANEMLGHGGYLTARIPMRLREKEGISYGAGSVQEVPYDNQAAAWMVYAYFNPAMQTKVDAALREEIDNALKNGFTQTELKSNKDSWLIGRTTNLGSDGYLLDLINNSLYNNSSLDEYTELENNVKNLTTDKVNQVVKKYIKPSELIFIYAGDFEKIKK